MTGDAGSVRRYLSLTLLVLAIVAFGMYAATVSTDFTVYYRAGAQALAGDSNLYPDDSGKASGRVHYFRAMPAIAWAFAPFALLPFRIAAFLFFLLKVGGLAGIVTIASRSMGVPPSRRSRIALGAFAAAGGYMIEEMRYGNAHLLVLWAIALALHLAHSGAVVVPAALLAVSIAIKLTPLLVAIYLVLTGRIRVALATIAGLVLLLLLPAVAYGWNANGALVRSFVASAAAIADQPRNHSLRGVVLRYLTSSALDGPAYPLVNFLELSERAATVVWLVAAAGLASVFIAAVLRGNDTPVATSLKDSLVIVAMLLFATHTQRIHFSWLFYPCCVLMALLLRGVPRRFHTAIRWTLAGAAITGTLLPVVLPGRRLSLAYEMASPYFVVTLALFLLIAWLIHYSAGFAADSDR